MTVIIVVPGNPPMRPSDRHKLIAPIDKMLKSKGIGFVSGGRTGVRSFDIDISVEDYTKSSGISILKKMERLGCPQARIIVGH